MKRYHEFLTLAVLLIALSFLTGCSGNDNPTTTSGDPPETWEIEADGSGEAPTIQAAVDAAGSGDLIVLGDGTYAGEGNRDIDFNGKNLTVKSSSGNPEDCIIDCGGAWDDPHRGFWLHNSESSASVIEGLTITNGNGNPGGGLRLDGASPTIRNCVFFQNESENGGGLSILSGSNPEVAGCVFLENSVFNSGGGLNVNTAEPTFRNCVFIENNGGILGGGIRGQLCSISLIECTFYGNVASAGSGVAVRNGSHATIERCIISHGVGRAVDCSAYDQPSSATLTCCDLYENQGGDWVNCIEDQSGNDGNMSEDPLFCDAAGGDVRLHADSPCLSAGACGRIGALGQGCALK